MKRISISLFCLGLATLRAVEPFPSPFNSEPDQTATPPGPQEALALWNLPEGFTATLFAAEPEIQNPIALAWDHRGRLWVAENYTYAEKAKRFELGLRDRILIFEDTDGDGRADSRKVFTDNVQMLTSIEVGRGGVWAMCPPQLLFFPDRNQDDAPDSAPEVILDGFTVAESNYHNFANGLRWGPDGWLYGRCGHSCPGEIGVPGPPSEARYPPEGGVCRYHPERKTVEVVCHGTTNPWGHDWDRHGELFFINTVNGHLWHGIAGAHFRESFGADPNPRVYERLDMHADHWHFDTTGKWSESRDGAANAYGGGHAHIGMMIYQAPNWPEVYQNRLFTLNMHGRRANVERLERVGSGYVGRHDPDVFLTDDAWFRGMEISQGPDGEAYVLDWSDTGECHDHTGVHRTSGRIYRIAGGGGASHDRDALAALVKPGDANLAGLLAHPNVWFERQLRQRLIDAIDSYDPGPVLLTSLREGSDPVVRLRALWNLHAVGQTTPELLRDLLSDPDEHLRGWAIRLQCDAQPIDRVTGPHPSHLPEALDEGDFAIWLRLAAEDTSGLVRLALASSLQRLPFSQRAVLGPILAARDEDAEDHNLPAMVWYGLTPLVDADPAALVKIVGDCRWPTLLRWVARGLAAEVEKQPEPLDDLLTSAATLAPALQVAVLGGVSDAFSGWRQAPKPASWEKLAATLSASTELELATLARDLGALFGDGRAYEEIARVALDGTAELAKRSAALRTLVESRAPGLREICETTLADRSLLPLAARGLANFDDPALGPILAGRYGAAYPADRPVLLEVLTSRPAWAAALLKAMKDGKIPRSALSAFQARSIQAFGDEALSASLAQVWGDLRESGGDKRALIEQWTATLSDSHLADADLPKGRQAFAMVCGACHVLYGEGGKIGPDLTGSGRADLGYVLENVLDPSAVVPADYRMTLLTLTDGRVLAGVISAENDRTLTLRQAEAETTVELAEVKQRDLSPVSMMPEGLLLAIPPEQVRDLIAYLRHPQQVPLPE